MLVSDYRVLVTDEGDGIIAFLNNEIMSVVLILKSNTMITTVLASGLIRLRAFKFKYYAIAKWIVRDLRKEGFIFKALQEYPSVYIPVYYNKEAELAEKEKLQWFYYEQELIKKKLNDISLDNKHQSSI